MWLDIRDQMSKATEDAVRTQFSSLKDAAALSAVELQKNVHKNYTEFVKTSKAISVMETDMLTVRAMLNELRSVGQELLDARADPDVLEESPAGKDGADSEVKEELLLRQQRKQEMAKIILEIEGAQALMDGIDRYPITEGDLVELDPDDYHTAKVVHLTLFNDSIMISSVRKAVKGNKRKSSIIQPNRLVADKFLPLKDMAVVNVRDSEELRNAFKLMKHPVTYLFKATGKEDKLRWTSVIKEASDTLMKVGPLAKSADASGPFPQIPGQEFSDSDDEEKTTPLANKSRRRKTLAAFFGDSDRKKKADPESVVGAKPRKGSVPVPSGTSLRPRRSLLDKSHATEKVAEKGEKEIPERLQDPGPMVDIAVVRQLAELAEELDVFIAQRQFDTAVSQIEKSKNLS